MTVRAVEGKKPYTGGKAIEITEDKVINLRLRDENNLIIRDEGDNEIYVDLQLDDEIRPTDAFPVGVTTGRVISDNGWDYTGTVMIWKTTSGDYVMLLYADDGKVYIDNGTGTLKQIYLKPEIDAILQDYATIAYLQDNYSTTEYVDSHDTQVSATEPATPTQGMLWYNTTNNTIKVYDGTQWNSIGGGGGGSYTAGNGINIDVNDEISIDTSVVATQTDLSNKANKNDLNTKTFFLSSLSDTSTLQSIVNWMGGEFGTPPTKEAIIVYNNVSYIFRGYSYEEVEGDWVAYYRFYDFELQYDNGYWKQKNLVLSTNPIFCGTGYDIPFLFGTGIDTTNGRISVDTTTVALKSDLGTAAACNTGTSSGNVPVLDSNGKLNSSILPGVALTDTFTVTNKSDLTSLTTAEKGDLGIVTSENKTYVLSQEPYSTLANWLEILAPNNVTSVNSQTGAVTLDADDISDTNTTNKFVTTSEKTTWNGKQDTISAGTGISISSNQVSVDTTTVAMQSDISVVSGDTGVTYIIKKSSTPPAAGTPSNVLTFVG